MKSTLRRPKMSPAAPVRVVIGGELEIPPITNLEEFREWARSDDFPERGRIDYIDGRIEVDEVTEDAFTHGTPKAEIARVVLGRVRELRLGHTFIDAMRVTCPPSGVSVEPDVVVVSHAALTEGRVRLVAAQSMKSRRYVELEGAPDLVVEVLSDSSVEKDSDRLFRRYFETGVAEYWLADARGHDLVFDIHHRGKSGFRRAPRDQAGFQRSRVLKARYRFEREPDRNETWFYTLHQAE